MIKYDNGGILIQTVDELPNLGSPEKLFFDIESTSFDDKVKAFHPYHGHRCCGIGVALPDSPVYYIPMRHRDSDENLPVENVQRWFKPIYESAKNIIAHNAKFDAHFAYHEGWEFGGNLVDTMTLAKILYSDLMSYSLKALSLKWLEKDISPFEKKIKAFLKGAKSYDYGIIPVDQMGEYCGQDVSTLRDLYNHITRRIPEDQEQVVETEIDLTAVLYDMEKIGMRVDPAELAKEEYKTSFQMLHLEEKIQKIAGFPVRPHTNADCFELFCNKYGLPILGFTDDGNPSFDKAAMLKYENYPLVLEDPDLQTLVQHVKDYRIRATRVSMFLRPWQKCQIDGIMHPSYNQAVRTGRLSCRDPNMQMLNAWAKQFIHPRDGRMFFSSDYSQIEFRLIVHYIQNAMAIQAYNENPNTDFHLWVADSAGIPRPPAKNMNFMMGFGGGRKKAETMLANVEEFVQEVNRQLTIMIEAGEIEFDDRLKYFGRMNRKKARDVYDEYHETLPELKRTSNKATKVCKQRGYIRNFYGRRRHLIRKFAHKAFNAIIQSTAADVMKERTVALSPRFNDRVREMDIDIVMSVHDRTVFEVPLGAKPADLYWIERQLEKVPKPFRVPIRTNSGISATSLYESDKGPGEEAWSKICETMS